MLPLLLALLSAAWCGAGAAAAHDECPAGPFKLHNFSYNATEVDKSAARPYFIVLCDLATTVRLDPLMHPDKRECHSHMHSVFGSNRFGPTVSLADVTLGPEELACVSWVARGRVVRVSQVVPTTQLPRPDVPARPHPQANTTCHIPADGSMYWAPSMYFHNRTLDRYFLVPVYMKVRPRASCAGCRPRAVSVLVPLSGCKWHVRPF